MRIGLIGVNGKMNRAMIAAGLEKNYEIFAYSMTSDVKVEGVHIVKNKEDLYPAVDVIIDFSIAEATVDNFVLAQEHRKPILICSTGHDGLGGFDNTEIPVLVAPNTSIEWFLTKKYLLSIAEINPELEMCIDDIHSSKKRDAPSGTAKSIIEMVEKEVQLRVIRGPNLASWHRISFFGEGQVINIDHQVLDRSVYAHGALKLARIMLTKSPGLYTVDDLYRDIISELRGM